MTIIKNTVEITLRNTDKVKFKYIFNLFNEEKPKTIEDAIELLKNTNIPEKIESPESEPVTFFKFFFNNNENKLNLYLEKNGLMYSTMYINFSRMEKFSICKSLPIDVIEKMKNEDERPEYDEVEDIVLNRMLNAKTRGNETNTIKKVIYDQHKYFSLDNRTSDKFTIV